MIDHTNLYNPKINSYDYLCRDCLRHVPKGFIEYLISEAKNIKEDRKLSIGFSTMADLMVTIQRCPICSLNVLDRFEKLKEKRREKKKWWGGNNNAS